MEQFKQETSKKSEEKTVDLTYTVNNPEFTDPGNIDLDVYLPSSYSYIAGPKINISKDFGGGTKINALLVYLERTNDNGGVLNSTTTTTINLDITTYDNNNNPDSFDIHADFVLVIYHDVSSTRTNNDVSGIRDLVKDIHDNIVANGPYNEDMFYKFNYDGIKDDDKRPKKAGMTIMTFKA